MTDYDSIRRVMALYVRGADRRDGRLVAGQFLPEGEVRIRAPEGADRQTVGTLQGQDQIAAAVSNLMAPHGPGAFSHHATFDPLIEVEGDAATLDTQFIMFETQATARPEGGWPVGTLGVQGNVTPKEAGYYRASLRRGPEGWKIAVLTIDHDLAFALPGA